MKRFAKWHRYREIERIFFITLILILPFIRIRGESALRFDPKDLKLYLFGKVVWIGDFYLILLGIISLLFLLITLTTVFGKVWCGWICPQTIFLDLSEEIAGFLSKKRRDTFLKIVLLPISALISILVIWYFIPPSQTIKALIESRTVRVFFLIQWIIIYMELAWIGRGFCKSLCPYSVIQEALLDKESLRIVFDSTRRGDCIGCDLCVRLCPVRIDPKEGIRRGCIDCAECIDACSFISQKRKIPPLIGYKGKILRPKTFLLGTITGLLIFIFFLEILLRPEFSFIITMDPAYKFKDITSYTYSIRNNGSRRLVLKLEVRGPFMLVGDEGISVPPYSIIHGRIGIKRVKGKRKRVGLVLKGDGVNIEKEVSFL